MRLKKLIRDFFGFSKTEVNGTLVLIPAIVFLLFTPYLYRHIVDSENHTASEDKRLLDSLVSSIDAGLITEEILTENPITYFPFNPNTASVDELTALGIPKFLATRMINYRSQGGKFLIKRDVLKIYDFPDSLFDQLSVYMLLPDEKQKAIVRHEELIANKVPDLLAEEPLPSEVAPKALFRVELNSADSLDLWALRGIGKSYARRIISYRKLLGGYHSISQLQEVYGMSDTLFQAIRPYLVLSDSIPLRKISINLATFKELLAHPYIDYEQTKEILNSKSENGKFRRREDMFRLKLMDSVKIERLLPYLNFQ